VGLKYAFHDAESSRLVLVIDLMMGGDLKYWLSQQKCFGFEASRYYAARTLLGLKALHDRDFVYRDVKPENMLVDEHGRVRLSDLGLACRVRSRAEINR